MTLLLRSLQRATEHINPSAAIANAKWETMPLSITARGQSKRGSTPPAINVFVWSKVLRSYSAIGKYRSNVHFSGSRSAGWCCSSRHW